MSEIIVIGAGVVGKATGYGLIEHGNSVSFADISDTAIAELKRDGKRAYKPDRIDLNRVDAVFVSVTALTGRNGIDLTHLLAATKSLGRRLRKVTSGFPVIVYRCTMPPGTMRTTIIPLLEQASGRTAGKDFGVVYNPEYLRADRAHEDFLHPRIVTLASLDRDDRAHQTVFGILNDFGVPMHWLPFEAAEFQKYVNNVGNAIKISTYNFFRLIAAQIELDPTDVRKALELSSLSAEGLYSSVYGTRDFGPYGGACLPKDTKALLHFAREIGVDVSLLESVEAINDSYNTMMEAAIGEPHRHIA